MTSERPRCPRRDVRVRALRCQLRTLRSPGPTVFRSRLLFHLTGDQQLAAARWKSLRKPLKTLTTEHTLPIRSPEGRARAWPRCALRHCLGRQRAFYWKASGVLTRNQVSVYNGATFKNCERKRKGKAKPHNHGAQP